MAVYCHDSMMAGFLQHTVAFNSSKNSQTLPKSCSQGAVYVTDNAAYTWQAAVQETVDATLNRTVSSGEDPPPASEFRMPRALPHQRDLQLELTCAFLCRNQWGFLLRGFVFQHSALAWWQLCGGVIAGQFLFDLGAGPGQLDAP